MEPDPQAANPLARLANVDTGTVIADLVARFTTAAQTNIGFPAATAFDYTPLAPLLRFMVNNLGDPQADGAYPIHTKQYEREAVAIIADLLRAPVGDRWGYIASGASEATEYGLLLARTHYPGAIVYHSTATHHSVLDVVDRLRMRHLAIRTDEHGEIDYDDLTTQLDRHRGTPAVVAANIGTGATEAVDDVRRIRTILDDTLYPGGWIHSDAALSGFHLAVMDPQTRPGFDLADGADSIVISGHKFPGLPVPAAVVIVRDSARTNARRRPTYTGAPNTTIANSRSGLAAFALWYALHEYGPHWPQVAADCRALAESTRRQLAAIGVDAWRHDHALTLVLPPLPTAVTSKWILATEHGTGRIVFVPGITETHVNRFVDEVRAALHDSASSAPAIPAQRRRLRLRAVAGAST